MTYGPLINRAPKGGMVSPLNGEFYEGGQFLANTPLPKGVDRKAVRLAGSGKVATIKIAPGYRDYSVSLRRAGEQRKQFVFSGGRDECVAFAERIVTAQNDDLRARGLDPHQTKILEG